VKVREIWYTDYKLVNSLVIFHVLPMRKSSKNRKHDPALMTKLLKLIQAFLPLCLS
jgi:hypothetical protein